MKYLLQKDNLKKERLFNLKNYKTGDYIFFNGGLRIMLKYLKLYLIN